ncbi:MAG: hypothetical protein NT010_08370 [Proteobacteria bacterium]|nr:hypothetical protein [Pseudomonadota bacterium]
MDIYDEMMNSARNIAASFPDPHFYETCAAELTESHRIYQQSPLVAICRKIIAQDLARNPGHGLDHAERVAVEAGALVLAEGAKIGLEDSDANKVVVLAHVAGLLHDMRRGDQNHAEAGAIAAGSLLDNLGVPEGDRQYVVQAIANHEAFVEPAIITSTIGKLLSDTLYDADKFRWGPDNFIVTLWEMLRFSRVSIAAIIPQFLEGMEGISRIKDTFLSHIGRVFGPEFIDLGLSIGNKIYEFLRERFTEDLT